MVLILEVALFPSPLPSLIFHQNEDFLNLHVKNLLFRSLVKVDIEIEREIEMYIYLRYIHVVFSLYPLFNFFGIENTLSGCLDRTKPFVEIRNQTQVSALTVYGGLASK